MDCSRMDEILLLRYNKWVLDSVEEFVFETVSSWWKRLVCGVWAFVSCNLWLFAAWLLILGAHRWPVLSAASDQLLVVVRSVALSDIGNNLRNDCLLLYKHPLFFLASFLFFVFTAKRFVSSSSTERDVEERPWWDVLLSRPFPPSEVQIEENLELLIQRLATPHFWLQPPVTASDYIKDLPVWRFKAPTELDVETREMVNLMDSDNPCKYESSSEDSLVEELVSCAVKGMLPTSCCAVCLENYHNNTVLCGLPCGHNYHRRCIHTWLHTDNHHCPICRWPVYKNNHPRFNHL